MGNLEFDSSRVEPNDSFEVIPPGQYLAVIFDSQFKENSKKTGRYLKLAFEIIDGPHKGRQLWSNLNLENPSDKAVQIAQGELSAICRAVGIVKTSDSSELHNRPLLLKVRVEDRADTGEPTNRIVGYSPAGKPAANAAPRVRQQTSTAAGNPPWKNPTQPPF